MVNDIYWPEALNQTWNYYDQWAGDDFKKRMIVVNYIPGKLNLAMILLFTFLDIIRIVILLQQNVHKYPFSEVGIFQRP